MTNLRKGKGKEYVFSEYLPYSRHCARHVTNVLTLVLCELNLPASSFAQRLNNLSRVAQLKKSGAEIQTQSD